MRLSFLGRVVGQLGLGKKRRRRALLAAKTICGGVFPIEPLEERELLSISTWVGGHGNNWSTAANWQGSQVPAAGAALVFSGTNTTTNDDIAGLSVASIELSSNNFVLGGNSLTVTSGITDDSGVSGGTISLPIALGGPVTINAAGSTSALTISGVISGSNSLTEIGGGTVNLTGTNTYTGGTTIGNSLGTLAFAQGSLGTTGGHHLLSDQHFAVASGQHPGHLGTHCAYRQRRRCLFRYGHQQQHNPREPHSPAPGRSIRLPGAAR